MPTAAAPAHRHRWMPDSLFGRLALLLIGVALVSHVLALSLLFEMRPDGPPPAPPGISALDAGQSAAPGAPGPHGPHGPPLREMLADIAIRLGAVLLAAWVGARWLAAPMRRLAEATRALAQDIHSAPIAEAGTRECREATAIINQLQQHVHARLAERDRFVAAVSHDLRTPLTRLQLRAQSLGDDAQRERFGRDIAEMDQMIRATLDYLRGSAEAEPWVELDLHALVQSLVHDQQDCGHPVALRGEPREPGGASEPMRLRGRLSALRRCITNLVENAVRYGGSAEIMLLREGGQPCLRVCDHGPGIPPEALEQVLLPFYRLEGSRNRHTGGVGLGLATAHDIARQHGAALVLTNRSGGGLQAELRFPAPA